MGSASLLPSTPLAVRRIAGAACRLAAFFSLALGATACVGLESGIDYPNDLPSDLGPHLLSPENAPDPPFKLNKMKIAPQLCDKIDTRPITGKLNQEDFSRFIEAMGVRIEPKKARDNLYWYDFPNGNDPPNNFVRLRLAVLEDQPHASAYLHDSLLEHGPGWWGVRRANLAVLAPKAGLHDALAFAIKYRLPCWGMLTYTGVDDAYVVSGPYSEL